MTHPSGRISGIFINAMRYKKKQLPLFCFLIVMLISCNDNSNINITIHEQIPIIVIEGYLTPNLPTEITVARNNLMDDELIFQSIWNAKVVITDLIDTLNLPNIYYTNKNRDLLVNYCNEEKTIFFTEDTLYLFVKTVDGDTLTAQTSKVENIQINKIQLSNDQLQIKGLIANDKFSGFLRLDVESFSSDTVFHSETRFYDCSQNMTPDIVFPLSSSLLDKADSLNIRLFHINRAYYSYQTSVDNAVSAYHDPFLIPESIKTNINGGTGIFTYYTFDLCQIKVDDTHQ